MRRQAIIDWVFRPRGSTSYSAARGREFERVVRVERGRSNQQGDADAHISDSHPRSRCLLAASAALREEQIEMSIEEPAHLFLKANGSPIDGESTQTSEGRENSIECRSVSFGVTASIDTTRGLATGVCAFEELVITKLNDKATPLLAKALCNSEKIEAEVKYYRPSAEDGKIENYLTIKGENGLIKSLNHEKMQATRSGKIDAASIDRVGFVFEAITWTYPVEGTEFRYNWRER
jgi:type VI secretion system secreted protein Hcp